MRTLHELISQNVTRNPTKAPLILRARIHMATFRGRHNATKSKVLIVLYHFNEKGYFKGFDVNDLAERTMCPLSSIKSGVCRWTKWRYLTRIDSTPYRYKIAHRGIHFVDNIIPDARLADYILEMGRYAIT